MCAAATGAVAPTEVHGQRHVAALEAAQTCVVGVDVILQCLLRVDAQRPPLFTPIVREVVGVVRVVYLDVGDALADEGYDLVLDDHCSIVEDICPGVVYLVRHARLVASRHHIGSGRHGHLVGAVSVLLDEGRFAARQSLDLP